MLSRANTLTYPTFDVWSSVHAAVRWLLHIMRRVWFRYAYPSVLFIAGMQRRGIVLSSLYNVLVLAQVLPALLSRGGLQCCSETDGRPCVHLATALVFAMALVARAVIQALLCAVGCCQELADSRALEFLGLGDIRCELQVVLTEIMGFAAALLSFLLSQSWARGDSDTAAAVRAWLPSEWYRFLPICILLVVSATLDFNAFAVVYHTAAIVLMLSIAWVSQRSCLACARCIFRVVLFVAVLHLVAVRILRLPFIERQLPASVLHLLGAVATDAVHAQWISTFVLVQAILWEGLRLYPATEGAVPDGSDPTGTGAASVEPAPLGTGSVVVELQSTGSASAIARTLTSGLGRGISIRDVPLLPRPGMLASACEEFASRVLPLLSFLLWSVACPALAAVPLLLSGVVLMHRPLSKPSKWLLHLALVYESLACVALHSAYMLCSAWSSLAPCKAARKGLLWVLLKWNEELTPSRRSLRSFEQALALLLLAAGMRSAAAVPAPGPQGEQRLGRVAALLRRWIVCLLRVLSLAAVAMAALGATGSPSLLGLGYVLWLVVCLPASGGACTAPGWSGLRGSAWAWRLLLLYSQGALIALYVWLTVLSTELDPWDFDRLVGFDAALGACMPHIAVAVLASMQLAAFQAEVQLPASLMDCCSPLAWLAWRFGVFVQMALVFAVVMQDPKSVVSFLYLVLFIGVAAVEQFRGLVLGVWHRRLFFLTAAVTAVLALLVYASELADVSEWLARRLGPTWMGIWGEGDFERTKYKLATMLVLQLHSCCLYRVFCSRLAALAAPQGEGSGGVHAQPEELRLWGARAYALVPERLRSALLTVRRRTRGWSKCALVLVAFLLIFRVNVLAVVQLLLLLALVVNVKRWRLIGTLISLCAMFSLLVQYLFRFPASDEHLSYWGTLWESVAIRAEIVLLLLGIVQRAVHVAAHEDPDEEAVRLPTLFLSRFGAHIAMSLLALLAVFRTTAWSLLYLLVVSIFTLSADSSTALKAQQTKRWLRCAALLLALALAQSWVTAVWLPPGLLAAKPSADAFADSWVCRMFDSQALLASDGTPCDEQALLPGCETQRARCGQEWQAWLGLGPEAQRLKWTLPEFTVLFAVCLMRKACLQAQADAAGEAGEASPSSSPGQLQSGDEAALEGGCEDAGFGAVWLTAAVMSLSLVGAFTLHSVASCISLTYVVLLFSYLNMVHTTLSHLAPEEGPNEPDVLHTQVRTLRRLRLVNLLAVTLAVIFQVPSTPCPYSLPLGSPDTEAGPVYSTMYTSSEQCAQLEDGQGMLGAQPSTSEESWIGVLLRCIGVSKASSWFYLWNWLVFSSALAHALACSARHQRLREEVLAGHARIARRRCLYAEHLRKWCRLELAAWDTKQSVLLVRLDLLMVQLHELREFWENRRPAPGQDRQARQKHTARVLDLLLQSGSSWMLLQEPQRSWEWGCRLKALYDAIDGLLQEFEAAAKRGLPEQGSPRVQHVAAGAAEVYLIEYLQELKDAKRWQLRERALAQAQEEDCKLEKLELCTQQVAGSLVPLGAVERLRSKARIKEFISKTLIWGIDDLIFVSDDDPELCTHRQDDGLATLFWKALLSQTYFLLVAFAVLQFAYSCSVVSAVTVCAVVTSLMAFPHAPAAFWRVLQWYNVAVIVAKITFQLPVFCSDGSINLQCGRAALPPWLAAIGLVKVDSSQGVDSGFLVAGLCFDVWVCVLLFVHCHVLCQAGRLGSPEKLRREYLEGGVTPSDGDFRRSSQLSVSVDSAASASPAAVSSLGGPQTPSVGSSSSGNAEPGQESSSAGGWRAAAMETFLGSIKLHRPARDLYAARFLLAFICLVLIVVCWSSMVGSGRSLEGSLSNNSFSIGQVFTIVVFVALLLADRAFYTSSTQLRFGEGRGTQVCTQLLLEDMRGAEESSDARLPSMQPAEDGANGGRAPVISTTTFILQRVLLGVQLFVLHLACILVWRVPETGSGRAANLESFLEGNLALFFFYVLYMTFLALTSLQLRYNIHVTRGGHMLTHSTNFSVWLMFKVYQNIPFMEELRVLTDWTITTTSLNFWMWMKTEDAQQSLYNVKCDMEARRLVKPYDPRPAREKLLQGAALLLGLYLLIVGPIAFFSPLNLLVQPNSVVSGALSVSLKLVAEGKGVKTVRLFDAAQNDIRTLSDDEESDVISRFSDLEDKRLTVQHLTFPTSSDSFWQVTSSLRQQLVDSLSLNSSRAYIVLGYQFDRNSTSPTAALIPQPQAELTRTQMVALMTALNGTESRAGADDATTTIMVPHVYVSTFLLDSTPVAKPALQPDAVNKSSSSVILTLAVQRDMYWSIEVQCGHLVCPLSVDLASLMISIFGSGGSQSSSGTNYWSVTGMYSFVLFVVGSFLRSVFKDSSKRMIWEELQDTEVLEGLCNGIYLARMKGQLDREYTLYYLLVRIYRSPELLFKVARPKVPLDPHEDLDGDSAIPGREGAAAPEHLGGSRESFTAPGPGRAGRPPEEAASSGLRHRGPGEEARAAED